MHTTSWEGSAPMNLRQLRYFVEVCNCKSVTKAAAKLHVSQPSISNAIKDLEQDSGVSLFVRMNKTLSITQAGEFLYDRAVVILIEMSHLESELLSLSIQKKALRVGLHMQTSSFLLPILLDDFEKAYPSIEISIAEHATRDLLSMLNQGMLDVAIAAHHNTLDKSFSCIGLLDSACCFVTNEQNPLSKKEYITFADLENEPLVLPNAHYALHDFLLDEFAQAGITPNVMISTSSLYTVNRLLRQNAASAFLLQETKLDCPACKKIPLRPSLSVSVSAICKGGIPSSRSSATLIRFLQDILGAQPPRQ